MESISRRYFLKYCGFLTGGFLLFPLHYPLETNNSDLGRVTANEIQVFSKPSFQSKVLTNYSKDQIFQITDIRVGEDYPPHNRIWYQVNHNGFAHSGSIQPVIERFNSVTLDIPKPGAFGEVTVPFTDARWLPRNNSEVVYRLYFSTIHYITGVITDNANTPWYKILDDRWGFTYYVSASTIKILQNNDFSPINSNIASAQKRLEVSFSKQIVIAYEANQPVFITPASTGGSFNNISYATPIGTFDIGNKRPSRHMIVGNLAHGGSNFPGVPWVCYFADNGIAFHGTYWHNDFGTPHSHGCVNLPIRAAKWIFRWSQPKYLSESQPNLAQPGTVVKVIN